MANAKLFEHLNKALSIEYSAVVQYCQHSALVQGQDRKLYEEFFTEASVEARDHAKKVSDWIVSLGGVPTIEAAHIQQSTNLEEMLQQNLETEKEALQAYRDAHACVEGDEPIKFMLEDQIMTEQNDVWEIQKFLSIMNLKVEKKIDLEAS
jgi:bacterioferritin